MKPNNGKVEIKTLQDFMIHFDNIDYYIEEITTSIGTRDHERKVLIPLEMDIDPNTMTTEGASRTVKLNNSGAEKKLMVVNTEKYFLENNYGFPGLNQVNTNPNLYLAIKPLSEKHLSQIINTIANHHPPQQEDSNQSIQFIVLGDRVKHQNLEIYKDLLDEETNFIGEDSDVLEFTLPHLNNQVPTLSETENSQSENKTETKEMGKKERKHYLRERDVVIQYIHAEKNILTLSSDGINDLYQIYQKTILKDNPLVIHDNDSTEKAAKLALAFEIVRNFDICFKTFENETICRELEKLIENLRCSFSPNLLTNVDSLSQAVYLAFALKIYEYESILNEEIDTLLENNRDNTKFASRKEKIESSLGALEDSLSYRDKAISLWKSLGKNHDELNTSTGFFTGLKGWVTGTRTPYQILNTLRILFNKRADFVEPRVLDFLITGELLPQPIKENGHREENRKILALPDNEPVAMGGLGM